MGIFSFLSNTGQTVAANLPYQELYDDGSVLTKDFSLMKCWRVVFPDVMMSGFKADEAAERIATAFHRHSFEQKFLHHSYYFLTCRIPMGMSYSEEDTGEVNMSLADLEIDKHRMQMFADEKNNLMNVNYVCCKVSVSVTEGNVTHESFRICEEIYVELENALRTMGAELIPLSCSANDARNNILSFLKYVCSIELRNYSCPKNGMSNVSSFISTKALQKGKPMLLGDDYIQMLTLNDFPTSTYSCILSNLLNLPFPFRWCTRWIPKTNRESQLEAKKLKRMFDRSVKSIRSVMYEERTGKETANINVQAKNDSLAVEEVMDDLTHGETLGEMTSTIELFSKDIDEIYKQINKVKEKLSSSGFDAIVESPLSNFDAWLSSLPGNSFSGRRRPLVTASNISHIVPFTGIYRGASSNQFLGKICGVSYPHAIGRQITGEKYFLNLNGGNDDVGHTFIVGATGSGKSVLLSFLASQWARYPKSRVIYFDKGRSFANIVKLTNGRIYTPGDEESNLQFMPLARIREKPYEALHWLVIAVEAAGTPVTPKINEQLMEIVKDWDSSVPTLERYITKLRGSHRDCEAIPALERITDNTVLNRLFGAEKDTFNRNSFSRKTMIEMEALMNMGDIAIYPAIEFIFSRIEELVFDNRDCPTLIIIDEAWLFLNHSRFKAKISEWMKVLRKNNTFLLLATQEIGDIENLEQFLGSCHTQIFLPNPALREEGVETLKNIYRNVGLSDAEIAIIGRAERKREYYIKQREGAGLIDFCIDNYQLERLARDGY